MSQVILGQVVMSKEVKNRLYLDGSETIGDMEFAAFIIKSLQRYIRQDWGDAPERVSNDLALRQQPILAIYNSDTLPQIWITTDADRSTTTIKIPDYVETKKERR